MSIHLLFLTRYVNEETSSVMQMFFLNDTNHAITHEHYYRYFLILLNPQFNDALQNLFNQHLNLPFNFPK